MLASLYPIVTVLLAAAVLHERVAPMQRAGIVLTLTGVVLISRLSRLRRRSVALSPRATGTLRR